MRTSGNEGELLEGGTRLKERSVRERARRLVGKWPWELVASSLATSSLHPTSHSSNSSLPSPSSSPPPSPLRPLINPQTASIRVSPNPHRASPTATFIPHPSRPLW